MPTIKVIKGLYQQDQSIAACIDSSLMSDDEKHRQKLADAQALADFLCSSIPSSTLKELTEKLLDRSITVQAVVRNRGMIK